MNLHPQFAEKNYKYPIHNDSISKVLSTVIYIHPQNNYGTFIYDDFKKINMKLAGNKIELLYFQGKINLLGTATNQMN